MKKELEFILKLNDTDYQQKIKQITQQLKGAVGLGQPTPGQPQAGGAGGAGNDPIIQRPAMEAFFKSMQALRNNQDQAMRNHAKEQMKLMKDIAKEEERRGGLLKEQEKISKNKTKDLSEELRLKKELASTEEKIARLTNQAGSGRTSFQAARQAAMGVTQPVFVTNWPGGGMGGGGGSGGSGPGGGGGGNFWGGLGKSLGTAAALLATGAALIDQYTSLPITRTGSLGNATQSLVGGNLQEIASGNVIQSQAWMKEKQRASQMASDKFNSQMVTGPMNIGAGAIGLVKGAMSGQGAGQDANANMLMGTVTKTLSAALSIGAKGSIADSLSIGLGKASEEYFSTHQAQLMEDFGKNYEGMLQAQQKENPLKNLAVNYFQDRYKTDIQSQRMLGMNDNKFYGRNGFMEEANTGGFTGDMRVQMAQQMQAAGGSTRAMGGKSSMAALQAARGFDLTNAGSIMGSLSGGLGSDEATNRAFQKIMEESIKNGYDKSDKVEEMRRYAQQTAEVVAKTGAINGMDAQQVIEGLQRFQAGGLGTMKDIEGSKAAYQEYQGQSAATSGRGGAMQYASMISGGLAGKFDSRQIGDMMEIPEEDVHASNPFIQAMASKAGMKPEELVKNIIDAKRKGVQATAGANPAWQKTLEKAGINKELDYNELEKLKTSNPEAYEAYIQTESAAGNVSTYGGVQKRSAVVRGMMTMGELKPGEESSGTTAEGAAYDTRMNQKPGDRAADDVVQSAGVAAQAMLENFREFKTEITPAADALDVFTKRMMILTQVLGMTPEKDRAAAAKYAGDHLFTPIQPQGGSSTGGKRGGSSGGY